MLRPSELLAPAVLTCLTKLLEVVSEEVLPSERLNLLFRLLYFPCGRKGRTAWLVSMQELIDGQEQTPAWHTRNLRNSLLQNAVKTNGGVTLTFALPRFPSEDLKVLYKHK